MVSLSEPYKWKIVGSKPTSRTWQSKDAYMKKVTGYVTLKVEMFAENEEDWEDTLESTFALPLPHLTKNQVFSTKMTS